VVALLRSPETRDHLGKAGRRYALTWSSRMQAERLVAFYQETISRYSEHLKHL
jgi:hypothetical protein